MTNIPARSIDELKSVLFMVIMILLNYLCCLIILPSKCPGKEIEIVLRQTVGVAVAFG